MLNCGRTWQPTEVLRVIEAIQSSTCVVRVATDEGIAFLKGMGNPAGDEALAMEQVGCELASALGLVVPPFAVVELAGLVVTTVRNTVLAFGPAFISQDIRGSTGDPEGIFLRKLANPEHVPLLIAFDTWIRNFDRCPPPDYLDPSPKWDNLFFAPKGSKFEMVVIDHTHAFVEDDLETGLIGTTFEDDPRVFGAFPQFMEFVSEANLRDAAARIRTIDARAIEQIMAAIPLPWGPISTTRRRWCEALVARAERVEDYLIDGLVAQGQLSV